ncbi:MAG TPA: polysaccharide biosynthesis C-terminal domain-containing protein [Roseiflexaceae bacterium]|nr:polysaccharide biosynthesis C-terminal domain-containing protein [Roseiflexaceae bacterium]
MVWNTLFVPFRMVMQVLATVLKLNLLSPAAYGLLSIVSSANNGLGTAIDMGTQRALPKYIPETHRSGGLPATARLLGAVFGAQMALLAAVIVGLLAFRGNALAYLHGAISGDSNLTQQAQTELVAYVSSHVWLLLGVVMALLFLGVVYDILMAYLVSFFKQRAWNTVALVAGVLQPLLVAGALLAGWGVTGALVAIVVAPAVAVALALWSVARLAISDWRFQIGVGAIQNPKSKIQNLLPPGFIRYSGVSLLMTMTDFIASRGFVIFLVPSLSEVALLTAGAEVVAMMLSYLFTPMVGVQVPLFTRVRAGEGGTLNGAYQSLVRLQLLLLVPGGVGLMLLAQPALHVLAPSYTTAAPIVWVLTPCLFIECLLTTAHNALIVYEKLRIIVLSRVLALSVVPLVWLLAPTLGVVGVALAYGLARLVSGLWVTANGFRLLQLRWPWRFTGRVALASGIMGLVVALLTMLLPALSLEPTVAARMQTAVLLGALAVVGAAVFVITLRLLGGLDQSDREQLLKMKLPLKRWVTRLL